MQLIRDIIGSVWTALGVSIVISLAWFLIETRHDVGRRAMPAALAIMAVFAGTLLSQTYMALVSSYLAANGDGDQLTPYFPVAILALVAAVGGSLTLVWVFRPRSIPSGLWLLGVTAIGIIVGLTRLLVWPRL